jgi:hypothetical protein
MKWEAEAARSSVRYQAGMPEETEENHENLDSPSLGTDMNPVPPEYEAGVPTTGPQDWYPLILCNHTVPTPSKKIFSLSSIQDGVWGDLGWGAGGDGAKLCDKGAVWGARTMGECAK